MSVLITMLGICISAVILAWVVSGGLTMVFSQTGRIISMRDCFHSAKGKAIFGATFSWFIPLVAITASVSRAWDMHAISTIAVYTLIVTFVMYFIWALAIIKRDVFNPYRWYLDVEHENKYAKINTYMILLILGMEITQFAPMATFLVLPMMLAILHAHFRIWSVRLVARMIEV